jgi:hypothetical protein
MAFYALTQKIMGDGKALNDPNVSFNHLVEQKPLNKDNFGSRSFVVDKSCKFNKILSEKKKSKGPTCLDPRISRGEIPFPNSTRMSLGLPELSKKEIEDFSKNRILFEEEVAGPDVSCENGDCLLIPSNLTRQCKETYELVMEYMREENKSGWVLRSTINKGLQEKNIGALDQITARFNHLQEKGVKCTSKDKGLLFKFEGGRWKVRLNL